MTGNWNSYECEHAANDNWLSKGRICALDRQICFNYNKPELVAKCPTKKRLKPSGKAAGSSSPPANRKPRIANSQRLRQPRKGHERPV